MKKIVLAFCLFSLISVNSGAFAYIQEGTTTDIRKLGKSAYSEETLKIIDRVKYQTTGDDQYYHLTYTKGSKYKNKYHFWYEKAKDYLDPLSDDGNFGFYEVDFTNKFYPFQKFEMPEDL